MNIILGVDHDKIILLSTLFPTIPMLGKNCCVMYSNSLCSMLEIIDVVLYCIVEWARSKSTIISRNASLLQMRRPAGDAEVKVTTKLKCVQSTRRTLLNLIQCTVCLR